MRIDHIGSTAVPGMLAKPIVDIQVSVKSLDSVRDDVDRSSNAGFLFKAGNPDRSKLYIKYDGCHVHIRESGCFSEQLALLFRDFLRSHPGRASDYSALKTALKNQGVSRDYYQEMKSPFIWEVLKEAHEWSMQVGWRPDQV